MNLHVKILKKYKKNLMARFNEKNRDEGVCINIRCKLCEEIKFKGGSCFGCPFFIYQGNAISGCFIWIEHIIDKPRFSLGIDTVYLDDKGAITDLRKLRREAKKYIEWV